MINEEEQTIPGGALKRQSTHNLNHALHGHHVKRVSELRKASLFATLDTDGSGAIDREEFAQLYDVRA